MVCGGVGCCWLVGLLICLFVAAVVVAVMVVGGGSDAVVVAVAVVNAVVCSFGWLFVSLDACLLVLCCSC